MPVNKRPSFVNFPIPFDHPYTLPTLMVAVATSSLLYYYLQRSHTADLVEAVRVRDISRRRHLKRPEDRFRSLKVEQRFVNPFPEWREVQWWETAIFWLLRWKGNGVPSSQEELDRMLPVVKPSFNIMFPKDHEEDNTTELTESWVQLNGRLQRHTPSVAFTWLGQSTCLIRIGRLTILTDPVFSRRSINDHLGPRRLQPLPCTLDDIQENLDIVLVSHDHFDHLDIRVVRKLGNTVTWYVPLGLRSWFVEKGVQNVVELDWWQEIRDTKQRDVTIACVPAMHWSGSRTLFDKNSTLWCSYVIKSPTDRVFFCGDTGYSPDLFKAIGERYAPFTLAAIPIGSFKPEILMQHLHMGPTDAVKVHHDIGCPRLSVGIHWGTFMMSDEHYLEPALKLKEAWKQIAIQRVGHEIDASSKEDTRFITTAIGETVSLD